MKGIRLSEEQRIYIYETNTILSEGKEPLRIDDILETINHFYWFDCMLEHAEGDISEHMIKKFHHILKATTSDSCTTDYEKIACGVFK